MTDMGDQARRAFNRRSFLRHCATGGVGAALLAAGAGRAFAAADDDPLQNLLDQSQRSELGEGFDSASRTIHMPKASLPTLAPSTAQATAAAIPQYEQIVARGGWPVVQPVERLRLGNRHPSVTALRQRLAMAGDLEPTVGVSDVFDSYVEAAVRRFQVRHGISSDGIVRAETFNALNIPAQQRLEQLKTNVGRLEKLTGNLGPRFVMVNIPAAHVEAIENGVAVSRHTAVVGKPDRASPELESKIIEVNFNPYWTVPVSIVRKDLIPRMQKEPDYLTKNRIRIFDQKGNELTPTDINWYSDQAVSYRFKQDPGDFNSLGTIRINFPSQYGVYMHDTPLKNLFGDDFRFESSGCVRVQNVRELVAWLLDETPGWSAQEIEQVIKSGERKDARLKKPVPLHWVYVTAWATPDGVVQFREDIYNHDGLAVPTAATTTASKI